MRIMTRIRKEPTLDQKLSRCLIAIMADSTKPQFVTDPVERGHHEWLKQKLYDTMSAIYGAENNPLAPPAKAAESKPDATRPVSGIRGAGRARYGDSG
jgi:hypothetical protein